MKKMKAWQDSASLILAACHGQKGNPIVSPTVHNYKLLCLKRNQKSSFMPGMYVFPGGTVDAADSYLKWHDLFASFGFNNDSFASLIPKSMMRPSIFQSRQNELPREISLRITAIRETFEECGILVCRSKNSRTPSSWAEHMPIPKDELQMWQNKIHNDAKEFFTLCKKFECYPDLWALHEWRNWLSPTNLERRFNAAFYLACMPVMPYAEYDAKEMEDLIWETPENLCILDVTYPPPQQVEVACLEKLKNIDNLLDIAVKRNKEGVQLYLPIPAYLKDGVVTLLPGDTMYPKEVNLIDTQIIDKSDFTIDEFRKMTPIKNRMEYHEEHIKIILTDNVHSGENCVSFRMYGSKKANKVPNTKNKL